MSPTVAESRLDQLLSAADAGPIPDADASPWTEDVMTVCLNRLAKASVEQRLTLIHRLGRVLGEGPVEILRRRLSLATEGREADALLCVLNDRSTVVPPEQIRRFLPGAQAVTAAGLSGDPRWVDRLLALLDDPSVAHYAALALANLRIATSVRAIADRIAGAEGTMAQGLIVALESMGSPDAVPLVRTLLLTGDREKAVELAHALWRLTGREPLVPLCARGEDWLPPLIEAWRNLDLASPPRPRCERVEILPGARRATFDLVDGAGRLRLDFDPPRPGCAWARWSQSLYLNGHPLYELGSTCGTCETTLRLVGLPPDRAALLAKDIREQVANVGAVAPLLDALTPLLTNLRTGHYFAAVVDWDLERVTVPERSWLTRRHVHRLGSSASVAEPGAIQWPGIEHFQCLRAGADRVPTYGVLLPTAPFGKANARTVDAFADAIAAGDRPAAVLYAWLDERNVEGGTHAERFLVGTVLDGHHKLLAYQRQGVPARCLVICRLEECAAVPGEHVRILDRALDDLALPARS